MWNARVTFLCYCVKKSELSGSFSITICAIQACYNVRTIVSASSWQYSKQAWYTQIYILRTKAYYITHTNTHFAHQSISHGKHKHSYYTPMYIVMARSSSMFTICERADAGHSCIIFYIVRPWDKFGAHYAQAVSTVKRICRRRQ